MIQEVHLKSNPLLKAYIHVTVGLIFREIGTKMRITLPLSILLTVKVGYSNDDIKGFFDLEGSAESHSPFFEGFDSHLPFFKGFDTQKGYGIELQKNKTKSCYFLLTECEIRSQENEKRYFSQI